MKTPNPTLKALKATSDNAQRLAQQSVRRYTVGLDTRDRSLNLPASKVAKQIAVNDPHNPLKVHVFKVYPCRHVHYNQAINGRLFYPSFQRINKSMAYYHLLEDALGPEGLTTLAWHEHRYGQEG